MKVSSRNQSVSPPKNTTSAPVIQSIGEMRPAFTRLRIIAATVAIMNAAVAAITFTSFGPPVIAFTMKKTASGPKSIAMRRPGETSRGLLFAMHTHRRLRQSGEKDWLTRRHKGTKKDQRFLRVFVSLCEQKLTVRLGGVNGQNHSS